MAANTGDSIYYYDGTGALPPGIDSHPQLKQLILEHAANRRLKEEDTSGPYFGIAIGIIITVAILAYIRGINRNPHTDDGSAMAASNSPITKPNYQVFSGKSLHFDTPLLHGILEKYIPYYKALISAEQQRFLQRLQSFMRAKTFMVPAKDGYREMPILVSASAIQLTFGLSEYMLPWFEYICIHPKEYILPNPFRTLAGNVSGKTITLSWKHFLLDYEKLDGVNLGLHEMAHALQMQCEYFYTSKGEDFRKVYDLFESLDEHIIALEKSSAQQLYTAYALTNTDEFWASSVELFFEKPEKLLSHYPQIYDVIKMLLKQDPARSISQPVLKNERA